MLGSGMRQTVVTRIELMPRQSAHLISVQVLECSSAQLCAELVQRIFVGKDGQLLSKASLILPGSDVLAFLAQA